MGRYVSLRNRVQAVGLTDTGKVREHNEDSIALDSDIGLYVLADGMGGRSVYRMSGWRFVRAKGVAAFKLIAPPGVETVEMP